MSVDSASHDDVAGLFKRLGARAGAPQYHDFSDDPASAPPPLTPRPVPHAASVPVPVADSVPATPPAAVTVATVPVPPAPGPGPGPAPAEIVVPAGATPLQRLFHRLAQAPLQGPGQSPLARLRQR